MDLSEEIAWLGSMPHLSVYDTLGRIDKAYPCMRTVLQSGHGVAAVRNGIGRATRTGPSDGSQVVAGWKKRRSELLILATSPFLLPHQQGDRRPRAHRATHSLVPGKRGWPQCPHGKRGWPQCPPMSPWETWMAPMSPAVLDPAVLHSWWCAMARKKTSGGENHGSHPKIGVRSGSTKNQTLGRLLINQDPVRL